jgi:glycosyltransferase involved in cell wall biosynthesis
MRYFIKKCLNYAEGVIVLGNTLKHIFDGLIPNEKIFIVENGIDITYSSTEVLSKEIRDKKRILYLGNLVESKGIFDIVKSIPKVVKENSNVIFTFIGAWDNFKFKSEVMEFIHQNSLENYTEFLGVLSGEKKSKMVLNSDIFVFPTFYPFEGQPLVLIEAMAAGLPIITTDHGCIAEMIEDKVNGIIIEKHNPIMIKEANIDR